MLRVGENGADSLVSQDLKDLKDLKDLLACCLAGGAFLGLSSFFRLFFCFQTLIGTGHPV
jgi:hypothetical protein